MDETWLKTNMVKRSGRVPRGERLTDHAPFGHLRTQTFLAALRHDPDSEYVLANATICKTHADATSHKEA